MFFKKIKANNKIFLKFVNINGVNCVKHCALCKLFDPQTTAMSSCGNFAFINIQFGIHRGSLREPKGLFDTPLTSHFAGEEAALQ